MTKLALNIDIVDMLEFLGVRGIEKDGKEVWFQCPFPGHKPGSGNRNASFRRSDKHDLWVFKCFVCGEQGTSVEFWSRQQGIHKVMAKMALMERYGSRFLEPGEGNAVLEEIDRLLDVGSKTTKRSFVALDERHVEERSVNWRAVFKALCAGDEVPPAFSYMFERGFTWETLKEWEIGYDDILGMISIPYRDAEGHLIGFKGRAWWPQARPKYRMLGNKPGREDRYEFDTIDISQTLYGLGKLGSGSGRVILTEGEFNCMAMSQYGHGRVLGLSGQYLGRTQMRILASVADEAVLIFDENEKALRAALGDEERELPGLQDSMRVWIVPERETDPADASDEEVALWLDGLVAPATMLEWNI